MAVIYKIYTSPLLKSGEVNRLSSHFYLIFTGLKNRIKELFHKPGKLVLYLLVILGLAGALIVSLSGSIQVEDKISITYLNLIFFAFLLLFYGIAIQKWLASGDAIFDMSDVNLLFISPVNPRATLLYGLLRMMGTSFWAGFFILFQSGTLANFGVGFNGILILFGVFVLNMIVMMLLSLMIYSITNGKSARKRLARIVAIAIFIPLLVLFFIKFITFGDALLALNDIATSPIFAATPIIGWASAGAIALIKGELAIGLGWLGLLALTGTAMFLYIMFSRSDYYEDVLVATETVFEKKRAAAEGNVQSYNLSNAKVKVTKVGLGGTGAHVFLYKHLRETFRQNRFGFFSMYIFIMAISLIAVSIFARNKMDITTALQILMWIQVFMIGTGRGLLETYSHYIYMIPESPLKKLIWSNMELMLRTVFESILFLAIPGLILGSHPLVILGSMTVYIFFSLMLLSINYLSMRFTDANISQGILLMVYFFAVLLFLAPGLVAALMVGFTVGGISGTLLALTILSLWELLVAFICFALSKNVLHKCDMPVMKK